MPPVGSLFIIYDGDCGVCARIKAWILQQPAFVPVRFVAAQSDEALRRFPHLPAGELAVIGDTGEIWLGNRAWIVCLWALREYRDLAFRLTNPLLLPMARQAFTLVSANRLAISSLLGLRRDESKAYSGTCPRAS